MSIALIEIDAFPRYGMFDSSKEMAKKQVQSKFLDLLTFLHSLSAVEQVAYELTFLTSKGLPRTILSVHAMDNVPDSKSAEQLAMHIMERLKHSFYSCEQLVGVQMTSTATEIREILSSEIVALFKSEKVMGSNTSYAGYYYYTDVLQFGRESPAVDNYNDLFNFLLNTDRSLVSFQLIPTAFSQSEVYALSTLSSELKSIVDGVPMGGQNYRDASVEEPQKTYAYYTEQRLQPLYFCNIVAASAPGDVDSLAATLKASIQSATLSSVSIDAMHIDMGEAVKDYFHFPWTLANAALFSCRDATIWNSLPFQPINLMRLPFLYTAAEASLFFRLPIDDEQIRGIKSKKIANTNETISAAVVDPSNILFGALSDSPKTLLGAKLSDFTRHALIVGTPGSGKTTFAINLLMQFYQKDIPFLAIEPTKTEYRAMLDRIPDLQIFTPGNSKISALSINPFAPPPGITVEQYTPALMSAFKAAFDMETPLDVIFASAIRKCYTKYGWKNNSCVGDPDVRLFGLYEFILTFKELVASSAYSRDVRNNIETGGTFRLMNLIQQNSVLYDTVNAINPLDLISKPTVIELNAISDDEQKALLISLILIQISLYTISMGASCGRLKNVILLDEAHVLLGHNSDFGMRGRAKEAAVNLFQKMIAEIRAAGTGMIVADQMPSQVSRSVVANTDIKVAFRLVEKEEREIIANSTGMTPDYMNFLSRMQPGTAVIYYSRLETPKIICTPNFRDKEGIRLNLTDSELKRQLDIAHVTREGMPPFYECRLCQQCRGKCSLKLRMQADYYAGRIMILFSNKITDSETLTKYMFRLHELVIQYEKQSHHNLPIKTLCNCTKINFIRKFMLEKQAKLEGELAEKLLKDALIPEVKGI